MAERWYVLRPVTLIDGTVLPQGVYLTDEQTEQFTDSTLALLVRNVRLYDVNGEFDISWRERNKHNLRLRCLSEIGTEESAELAEFVIDRFAGNRLREFKGPTEKALAAEIRSEIKVIDDPLDLFGDEPKKKKPSKRKAKEA